MKKKMRYIVGGLLGATMLAGISFAATNDMSGTCPGYGVGHRTQLTAEQQKEMQPLNDQMTTLHKQMLEVRKAELQKEVSFGNLTQAQADQMISRMSERMANGSHGFCNGNGNGGCGGYGNGNGQGHGWHHTNQ